MSIIHVPLYPSDWLAGTRGMSAEESGVYITLVCRIYEMAGPIEWDDHRLARLCGCRNVTAFRSALDYLMAEGKIIEVDGGLFNERAGREIENVIGKSEKAKTAAESRWKRKPNKNKGRPNADASPKHPKNSEKSMLDECQSKSKPHKSDDDDAQARDDFTFREQILGAIGLDKTGLTGRGGSRLGTQADMAEAKRWLDDLSLTESDVVREVADVMARKRDGPPTTFKYFTNAMQTLAGSLQAPQLTPIEGGPRAASEQPGRPSTGEICEIADAIVANWGKR